MQLRRAQRGRAAKLTLVDVRVVVEKHLGAGRREQPDGRLIRHAPTRKEQRGFLAEQARHAFLETARRGIAVALVVSHFGVAMAVLGVLGGLQIYFTTSCNTTLQLDTPQALRGRVMGLYAMAFAGVTPFGSLLVGTLAEHLGVQAACAVGGSLGVLAVGALVLVARRRR